jgi:Fic family protein
MDGLVPTAGQARTRSDLEIHGSTHVPPPADQVPGLLAEACDFIVANPKERPLFLAAYIMWRVCWIHPFDDGNGRAARSASYLLLGVSLGLELHGTHPIPERIKHAPRAYWRALEAADHAWANGRLDVSVLEGLLDHYLQAQLRDEPIGLPPGS